MNPEDSSIGMCPASIFLKAMATSIDGQRRFTESDIEEGAPDIAIVDSDADDMTLTLKSKHSVIEICVLHSINSDFLFYFRLF